MGKQSIFVGDSYKSHNYGEFSVTEYRSWDNIVVVFSDTGFSTTTNASNIRKGHVKDFMAPVVFGVGYLGVGNYPCRVGGTLTKSYQTWASMLSRCYSERYQKRQPTYKGCSVTEEWHNFQNFAEWFEENYLEGYHLDKDIAVESNKVYSPSTCRFVTQAENNEKSGAKYYVFQSPEGKRVEIYNLLKFSKENKLNPSSMSAVHKGKAQHHKKWRKEDVSRPDSSNL